METAYCWLTTLETSNYALVDEAIAAMRKLLTHGRTFEQMKSYIPPPITTSTTTPPPPFVSKKSTFNPAPVSYNMESNWKRIDDNTIHIDLGDSGGTTAIAIAVTNEEMLDQMIQDIYNAPYIAVDCEFLGQKNALPELKLLQVGVSKEKGYAVQVDKLGVDVMTDKLKPILESEELNVIGWSFKSDALAIECYLKQVEMAPVLDLQAKLKPIAVEQLNLSAAMNKFASDWIGNNEFQKAKQYGTQFNFTGENCIWVMSPLPPRALVYAVFDVLSVVALHEATMQYESLENQFWPFTITQVESRKAVDNWHRLRAKGINATVGNQGLVNIISASNSPSTPATPPLTTKSSTEKGKKKASGSIITTLGDGYDDENDQFKREMELAIEASKKEYIKQVSGQGESSGLIGDRVLDSEDINYSELAQELDAAGSSSHHAGTVFSSHIPTKPSNVPEIVPGGWGTEVLDDQPFIGTGKKFRINDKEIDTSLPVDQGNNNNSNNSPNLGNKNAFNVHSPTFVPNRKRASISNNSNISNSPRQAHINTTDKQKIASPKQPEATVPPSSSVQNASYSSSPRQNVKAWPQATAAAAATTTDEPETTPKKPVSRWSNEPKEIGSQWGKQSQQQEKRTSISSASGSHHWRKTTSDEPHAQGWGEQLLPNPEKRENSTWGEIDDNQQQQHVKTGTSTNPTEEIHWSDNTTSQFANPNDQFSSAGDKGESGSVPKFTTTGGWGGKSESSNKPVQDNAAGSWGSRGSRQQSSSWNNDHSRNNSNQSNWRDKSSTTASHRSPAVTRASQSSGNTPQLSDQASGAWNSPSSIKSSPSFKPDKAKYTAEFKNRITVGNQGGSFTNYQPVGNEMSSASWRTFASSTIDDWERLGKDTPLDAIDRPIHPSTSSSSSNNNNNNKPAADQQQQTERIKFNTSAHSNYNWGGQIGDSSSGKMHDDNNGKDGWMHEENRPDTMEMPMNQIPVRKVFSGPRIMNPDDDGESDSDEDYDYDDDYNDFPVLQMNKMSSIQETKAPQKSLVHQLPTYVDGEFLYEEDGNRELSMLLLNSPDHLDMINIPPPGLNYTVTMGYHFAKASNKQILKAIQLYLSTGESYTVIIEKCCYVNNFDNIIKTKLGQLLTDPNIKRICWFPDIIQPEMIEKVGFPIGPCVDLSYRANNDNPEDEFMTFSQAISLYLKDWPDRSLYEDAKKDFDSLNAKKFSSSCWDRDTLPNVALRYSALQGLTAHAVYLETLKAFDVGDENFMYEYEG